MNNEKTEQELVQNLAPDTREWLIEYTFHILMQLPEKDRKVLMEKYN